MISLSPPRFSTITAVKELAEGWSKASKVWDIDPPEGYSSTRGLTYNDIHPTDIAGDYHHRSLIEVVQKLLSKHDQIKILELGAGAGLTTDEIKATFPDDVKSKKLKVFSTGIKKGIAKETRQNLGLKKLHCNDLRWRSIKELSDYPEFHLIYETYGELHYSAQRLAELEKSLILICKKLMPGGFASISTLHPNLLGEAILKYSPVFRRNIITQELIDNFLKGTISLYDRDEQNAYLKKALNEIFNSITKLFAEQGINIRISLKEAKRSCIEIQKAPFLFKSSSLFD